MKPLQEAQPEPLCEGEEARRGADLGIQCQLAPPRRGGGRGVELNEWSGIGRMEFCVDSTLWRA